jgi:type 1 glutamine amidotransferase
MKKIGCVVFIILFCAMVINPLNVSAKSNARLNILVFSKTNAYRHSATPEAIEAIKEIAGENNWNIELTEDSTYFTIKNLEKFDVIVFLLTIGEILDETGKEALKGFFQSGHGLVTIHTGTITLQEWPWFNQLIGAGFVGHPPVQQGKLIIEDKKNPSVSFIEKNEIYFTDEWYSFDRNPRPFVNVIISIDETSYDVDNNKWFKGAKQRMGDHPLVWCNESEGGRIFQTALGHEPVAYQSEFLRKHIIGAILWAGGIVN